MADTKLLQILIDAKDNASKTIKSIGDQFKGLGAGMAIAGGAITAALGVTVKAAMDAEKAMANVDATLKTMGDSALKNKGAILEAAAAATKLGFDDEDAAQSITKLYQRTNNLAEATKLNTLAMDLARAKNVDLATASNLVNKVLSGQGQVLKQYGIDLKESATPLQALGELQKVVGGQSQAFSETAAGSMEALQVTFGNLQESIGDVLLPVLTQLVQQITPIIQKVMEWMQANPQLTQTIVTVLAILGPLLTILPLLVAAIGAIASPVGLVILAIGALVAAGVVLYQNWDTIKAKATEIWENIVNTIREKLASLGIDMDKWIAAVKLTFSLFWEALKLEFGIFIDLFTGNWAGAWEKIKQLVNLAAPLVQAAMQALWDGVTAITMAAWEGLKNLIISGINWVIDKVNSMIASINNAAASAAGAVGLSAPQIPTIPRLATGGIVTKPTLALIGEAGPEAVVPLNKANGFGAPINVSVNMGGVNVTNSADEDRLADKVAQKLARTLQAQRYRLATQN